MLRPPLLIALLLVAASVGCSPDLDTAFGPPACSSGEAPNCPATTCGALLAEGKASGLYWLQPVSQEEPFETRCDFALEGGGWTLVAVVSDDGQDSWTWNQRDLWSGVLPQLGSAQMLEEDFRSPALHSVPFRDLLFIHAPSELRAVYQDIGNGETSLADHVGRDKEPMCLEPGQGAPLAAGTLAERENLGSLCDTQLYFNPIDQDGDAGCEPIEANPSDAWGPTWNSSGNDGCPFDDVGENASMGPSSLEDPDLEFGAPSSEDLVRGIGFGQALGLNTAPVGSGENRMDLYVR